MSTAKTKRDSRAEARDPGRRASGAREADRGGRGGRTASKRRARRLLALVAAPVIAALIAGTASAEGPAQGPAPAAPATQTGLKEPPKSPAPSAGAALPVSLAEVASRVDEAQLALPKATELLRKDVEAELAAADWSKLPPRKQYKLSASIVALEAAKVDPKTLRASCTVSVSIRDAKRGNILAILEGRAKVEDLASASARAQRDALAGAVRGAIAAVPEAIRRAQ